MFFINDQILIRLIEWKTHYNQWFKPLRETTPISSAKLLVEVTVAVFLLIIEN